MAARLVASRGIAVLVCLIVWTYGTTSPVLASAGGFHMSQQWTAQSGYGGFYHPPSSWQNHAYAGWAGIDGQIVTPTHFPNLGGTTSSHSVGWIEHSFAMQHAYTDSWFQIGWLAGCVSGGGVAVCGTTGLKLYDERYNATTGLYNVYDDGALGYNAADTYRVEHLSDTCWYAYKSYNVLVRQDCTFPSSGVAVVSSEVYSSNGVAVEMPTTFYGYSNPNTNNALRIKGGNGYVPWSGTLSSGETSDYDERSSSPDYWISTLSPYNHYWFESYGQCGTNC